MVKTKTIQLRDGRHEIVRVLSSTDLTQHVVESPADSLAFEKSIVWLEDITSLPFVRSVHVRCARSRRGRLRVNSGERVVGYSKLQADAPRDPQTARYTRRLFYLKETDLLLPGLPPRNAVDPRTILPGISGEPPGEMNLWD